MSRHRAIRNRAYSYDDDYYDEDEDDYYEEEEEEDTALAQQYRHTSTHSSEQEQQQQQDEGLGERRTSLSSFLDHATAQQLQQPTPPSRPTPTKHPPAYTHTHATAHGLASSPDGGRPHMATISEAFDADLVDPAFHLIKASGQAVAFTDDKIRIAVRQANYDADVALVNLLGAGAAAGGLPSSSSSSRTGTPSPPPRPSSTAGTGERERERTVSGSSTTSSVSMSMSSPPPLPPGLLVRPTPQRSTTTPLQHNNNNNNSNNNLHDLSNRVAGVNLMRSRTPPASGGGGGGGGGPGTRSGTNTPMRGRSPSPGLGPDGESLSATPGNVVASRASLGGLSRDQDVWEEDMLPPAFNLDAADETPIAGTESTTTTQTPKTKPRISMVVIGHVDAGKSTLMGQVLVATGLVSDREVRKYEKEAKEMGKASFYLAWLMDEDTEERAHGVTMEIGQKLIELPHRVLTLLDAPGHQDFIPQMITGAAQADVALLVVPATTGEFEAGFDSNGQTKEHALLARALGVTQLLVAINKLDAADPPWSQGRYEKMVAQLGPFLESTGFKAERIRYVPVSGLTGENVKAREGGGGGGGGGRIAAATPTTTATTGEAGGGLSAWYQGQTLLGAMDEFLPATKLLRENRTRPLRVFVTDVAQAGKNVGVSARVIQGGLRSGGKVLILPVGDVATVRTIEVEGRVAEAVQAGEHAELTLQGVDIARMSIGSVLCKGKAAVPVSRRFVAQITTLPTLGTPILKGTQFQMHMQSLEMPVHATRLVATLKKPLPEGGGGGGGEGGGGGTTVVEAENIKQAKPRCLMGGVLALVEMRCQRPICLERYEDSRALGRFVLRQKGETVAVGMITEILAD